MLQITRKLSESIITDDNIKLTVISDKQCQFRPAIEAPDDVEIWCEEIYVRLDAALADAIEFTNAIFDGEYDFSSPEHVDNCSEDVKRHCEYARKARAGV